MAKRAAVVIGVDEYDLLPRLGSPVAGAASVAEFLRAQEVDGEKLYDVEQIFPRISKKGKKPVTVRDIEDAIGAFTRPPIRYEMLVVYFSGHGLWHARSDHWLLSEAPTRPGEAINLTAAVDMAKYCGIPNVIFVSDACRLLPDDVGSIQITGQSGFLSYPDVTGISKVDVFRATSRATAAFEAEIEGKPQSVLTSALLAAFRNPPRTIVRSIGSGRRRVQVVPNRKLEAFLQARINAVLAKIDLGLSQLIEADVPSGDDVYMACATFEHGVTADELPSKRELKLDRGNEPGSSTRRRGAGAPHGARDNVGHGSSEGDAPKSARELPPRWRGRTIGQIAAELPGTALRGDLSVLDNPNVPKRIRDQLRGEVADNLPTGPVDHFETGCGFVFSGAAVRRASVPSTLSVERLGESLLRVSGLSFGNGTSVAVELEDGRCLVLAALPEYIGHCTVGQDGLRHVSYVPSSNSWRWGEYLDGKQRIDTLRAKVAVAANHGRIWLGTTEEVRDLSREMRTGKAIDPSLGLYAAYACSQAGDEHQVIDVIEHMTRDTGVQLFDVRMLARRPSKVADADVQPMHKIIPDCPLLTRGWNLIESRGMSISATFRKAEAFLTGSLWTTFRPGVADEILNEVEASRVLA